MVVHLYNAKEHINLKQQMDVLLSPLTMAGGEWVANDKGEVGPTAAGHKVTFRSFFLSPNQGSAEIHFTSTGIHFNLNVSGRSGQWIRASGATAETPRMTGLVYPLGKKRPAVVYKTSAVPLASLSIEYQRSASEPVVTAPLVSPSFLSMDYTRGLLRRHTEWMWASVCTREVGIHLSSGTYDVDGYSLENAFFAPHSPPQFLNEKVEFVKLEGETTDKWAIRGRNVSLTFTAFDGYGGKVNLGLVNVSLDHRWGLYDGYVLVNNTRLDLHQTPGVFEDHYALW
ncbi:hypothetical protein AGDE_05251 [Angomonas deanei]|uniref:Uncharacterized protein n=1 Tax=Angomonas deanei TaxID=59799 RepID=A0A7G2CFP9_9TRYP|nr:hypothetical protein AGDE_05251 [Angomonas deanei]CAD2218718.1 Protein of unknown function (DUF2804), putative [Angomonas deanei]|eukprot:EPY38678.1 hypothetical protein AGDE_05251 [Angomonas deanei]